MVDKAQLDAMNNLFKENPTLSGFRIYFGKDNDAKKVGIVIGVDASGKDMLKSTIFSTDSPVSSPCPPICDSSSPIIQER
jgi:tricorn protease-like protein